MMKWIMSARNQSKNDQSSDVECVETKGPWPFITRRVYQAPDQSKRIWSSRIHRKGLQQRAAHEAAEVAIKVSSALFLKEVLDRIELPPDQDIPKVPGSEPPDETEPLLKAIDDAGIADNTFVMYSTDNGPHMNSWPDAGMTPFRNEKNSNWEGAYRVPCMVRWPGKIEPGSVSNEIVGHHDWLPTLLAMAGDKEVKQKLLAGYKVGDMTYKVHLDGYDLGPYLTGQKKKGPRESFIYCNDDQQVTGLRFDNWKLVFMEQRVRGTMAIWAEPFITLRLPKIFNLRTDPYERADVTSNTYYDWLLDHVFLMVPAQDYIGEFLATFKDYPQRQKAASFNLDDVLKKLQESGGSK